MVYLHCCARRGYLSSKQVRTITIAMATGCALLLLALATVTYVLVTP